MDVIPAPFAARLALPALLLGAVAIGFSPIFVRLSELGPSATAFHRVLLALPLLWLWMRLEAAPQNARPRIERRGVRAMVIAGLFFAGDLALWHWSITLTSVANATLLANFAPIFVTVGAWLFLRERVTLPFLAGLALALTGAILLVGNSFEAGGGRVSGDVVGMLTGIFYAGYLLNVKRLRTRLSAATIMTWSGVVTAAALLPIALLSGETLLPSSASGWAVLIGLAWVSHAGGQGLIAWSLAHLPASFSSVTLLLQPVVAALLAWVLLAETLAPWQALGGVLVLLGILQARRAQRAQ